MPLGSGSAQTMPMTSPLGPGSTFANPHDSDHRGGTDEDTKHRQTDSIPDTKVRLGPPRLFARGDRALWRGVKWTRLGKVRSGSVVTRRRPAEPRSSLQRVLGRT